jgi:CRISPR-associated protein Cmr3
MFLRTGEASDPPSSGFIDATFFLEYLKGRPGFEITGRELSKDELRVGIEFGGLRTAAEGKFYSVQFLRLEEDNDRKVGFLMRIKGVEGLNLPSEGLLRLGGEARASSYSEVSDTLSEAMKGLVEGIHLVRALTGQNRFKLYVASPGIFQQGWLPDILVKRDEDYILACGSLEFRMVSAAVGKPVSIGGWDLANNQPRTMKKAVPAGSVYFFEKSGDPLSGADVETLKERFHFKSILTNNGELTEEGKAGYGLVFLGAWPGTIS